MINVFVGPMPRPITGQSVAFSTLVNNFKGDKLEDIPEDLLIREYPN